MPAKVTLYHGTQCTKVEKILKQGLRITCKNRILHEQSDPKRYPGGRAYIQGTMPRMADCGVYLTDKLESASVYASLNARDMKRNLKRYQNGCIIEVGCLEGELGGDGFGDLMTDEPIPPKCIRSVIYPSKWPGERLKEALNKKGEPLRVRYLEPTMYE